LGKGNGFNISVGKLSIGDGISFGILAFTMFFNTIKVVSVVIKSNVVSAALSW
jgi:hypothetical protein